MDRGSLVQFLKSNEVITDSIRDSIITGVVRGMIHLHSEQLIHRDLAARYFLISSNLFRNVLLTSNLEAKIADFGLTRLNRSGGKSNVTQATQPAYLILTYF